MFNEQQQKLFNQGYGAYREIIGFCRDNVNVLQDNSDDELTYAALVLTSDIQLQRYLLKIANFPKEAVTKQEETFIQSIVESVELMKKCVSGYGKFFHHITAETYNPISKVLDIDNDEVHISFDIAIRLEKGRRDGEIGKLLSLFKIVFNSFIALSESNEEIQNSIAIKLLQQQEQYVQEQGIAIERKLEQMDITEERISGEEALEDLIGLASVKDEVIKMLNIQLVNKMRVNEGLKPINVSKHMVFTGNPGTGKTTVARIIAQIYKENGIVARGQLVETDRSGLVDTIVGGTAQKVKNAVENAIGGVLFIDEAYALASSGSSNDFGNEAISTLVKLMEDKKDDLVVIVAGYKEEMRQFIDSNPGLKSRFNKFIEFEDYSPDEMHEIFLTMVKSNGYVLANGTESLLRGIWCASERTDNFGNGRGVRNIFEQVLENQATRIVNQKHTDKLSIITIEKEDIPSEDELFPNSKKKGKFRIGFSV